MHTRPVARTCISISRNDIPETNGERRLCRVALSRARVLSVYRAPTTRSRWPALACTARLSYPTAHPPRVLPVSSPHVQSHGKYLVCAVRARACDVCVYDVLVGRGAWAFEVRGRHVEAWCACGERCCRIPYSLRCQSVGHQNTSITISGMLYCILSGQEDSGGEVVVPWRESLRGFSHPAVHGRR